MGHDGTGVTLPMRDILNANVASIRVNDRGIKELAADIDQRGLRLPILVASDNLILSGCRRLAAMQQLGWTRVPVVVSDDWNVIVKHFINEVAVASKLGLPSEPLHLREFEELVENRLRVMFEPDRRQRIGVGRASKKPASRHPDHHRNYFTDPVAKMLGITQSEASVSREIAALVARCQEESPNDLGIRANELLDDIEANGGRLYSASRMLRDMLHGRQGVQYRLRQGEAVFAPIPQRSREPNARVAAEQVAAAERVLDMLETLGEMVNEIGDLNVAVDPDVAQALRTRYGKAQRKVGLFRTYLDVNSRRESTDA